MTKNNHSAFDTAVYYLGFKDRTEYEIATKLKEKGYSELDIAQAMSKLIEYGYVDDARYVRAYYKDHSSKKGPKLIKMELANKGIAKDVIADNISEIIYEHDIDETEIVEDIFNKRFCSVDLSDEKQSRRVYSYFARRGFSNAVISNILAKHRKID